MMNGQYMLSDIYIGDPDGLAEARKENFVNYFYTKNKAYKELIEECNKFIVTGRKGTGKTILAKYYEKQQNLHGIYCKYIDKDNVLFRQLQTIGNGSIPQRERAAFAKYALLCEIGNALVKRKKEILKKCSFCEKIRITKSIKDINKLIRKNLVDGYQLDGFKKSNKNSVSGLIQKKDCQEFGVSRTEEQEYSYSETAYYNVIQELEESIIYVLKNEPITIIIDDLDEYDEKLKENREFARFLCKFIEVAYKLNIEIQDSNHMCKIILLIRSDLLKILHNESTNLNKFTSENTIKLDWIKGNNTGSPMQHMLIDMICTKIRASISSFNEKSNEEICGILFPDKIKGDTFLKYVLKYSHGRPRDIVTMLNIIIRNNPDATSFSESMFLDCEGEYSKSFCNEIRNEMALYHDGEYVKQCFLFLNLINKNNFSLDAARKVYMKCKNRLDKINDIEDCFDTLYKFGVIGNVSGINPDLRYSFGYREDGHDIFNNCEKVTIHFALRKEIV